MTPLLNLALRALTLYGGALLLSAPLRQHPTTPSPVAVDSARRLVIVTAGPFHIPPRPPTMAHMAMPMDGGDSLVKQFTWPLGTLLQGVQLELADGEGHPLPRRLLHHLILVDFDRRQLVYPLVERLMAFGQETGDVSLPASIAFPLPARHRIGLLIMWDNETGQPIDGVTVRLTFHYAAPNLQPRPIPMLPFFVDANIVFGGHDAFDVPPGGIARTADFTIPLDGHLAALSGHLHDHGVWLRLEDLTTGKTIVTVRAKRDSTGHVLAVSRELLALHGPGPHLRASHRYRMEARYDNPTGDTLHHMMASMVGLFAPDDPTRWPALDTLSDAYRKDIASMFGPGGRPAGNPPPGTGQH
jgi:hypothetical protein